MRQHLHNSPVHAKNQAGEDVTKTSGLCQVFPSTKKTPLRPKLLSDWSSAKVGNFMYDSLAHCSSNDFELTELSVTTAVRQPRKE